MEEDRKHCSPECTHHEAKWVGSDRTIIQLEFIGRASTIQYIATTCPIITSNKGDLRACHKVRTLRALKQ